MELKIDRLTKQYGAKIAVDRISLTLTPGVTGLLGANGAGKTTLMRMLCGILKPTSGTVSFDGVDVSAEAYRRALGYLPQDFGYYPNFTGLDFLLYLSALKGLDRRGAEARSRELLELVGLSEAARKKIKTYSGGMKQRLGIAQALLNRPKLLILDEPTAGVDPRERIRIRSIIAELARDKIVLLATHVVTDVECIANEVLLMNKGRLVLSGTPEELIASIQGKAVEKVCTPEEIADYQRQYGFGSLFQRQEGQVLRLIGDELPEEFTPVTDGLSLEEVYLYYCA